MKPNARNPFLRSSTVVASIALSIGTASSAILEWKGSTSGLTGGTNTTWDTNTTANWWDGVATVNWPALGGTDDDAVFGGTAGTVTITTATANDITFNTTGYILSGGTLTLNGTTPTITNGAGIDATISSAIAGSSGLTKAGTGILTLSGTNNYTGTTIISAGTLRAGSSAALGSNAQGTTVSSGATLDIGGRNLGTEVVTISGTGVGGNGAIINSGTQQIDALGRIVLGADATIGGANRWDLRNSTPTLNLAGFTLTKTGANYIGLIGAAVTPGAGNIIINQGELNLSTSTNLGGTAANSVTVNNGGTLGMYQSSSAHAWTLNLNTGATVRGENGTSTQNIWAGAVNANGNFTLLAESGHNLTIQGNISGTGGLTKSGAGTAFLTGNNSSWNGGITISAGSLQVNSANALGTGTSITTAGGSSGAALVLGNGVTAGSGKSITISGGGAGGFFGALSTTGTATWQGNALIGAATGTRIGTTGTTGSLTISGNISEPGGTPSELIIRTNGDAAAVVLSGNNNYTGGTQLSLGTLRLGSTNAIGTGSGNLTIGVSSSNTTLSSDGTTARTIANNVVFSNNANLGDATNNGKLTFNGTVALGTANRTLTVNSPVEFTNTISATGAFGIVKAGSADLVLSGANNFTGEITINAGKLVAGNVDALGTAPKTINVSSGTTLELANNAALTGTYNLNTGTALGNATIVLNRATAGAAYNQTFGSYTIGNSEMVFQAGANVTSGTPTVTINSLSLSSGGGGLNFAKLTPTGVNLSIGTLQRTGSSAGEIRLGGTSTGNIVTGVVSNGTGGSYTLTKADSGTWELAGANTYSGATNVSAGKLIFSGARTTANAMGNVTVSNTAGTNATLDITNGNYRINGGLSVGNAPTTPATGTVNQSGGDVSFTGGVNAVLLGNGNIANTAIYNLSGGSITTGSTTASRGIIIGTNSNAIATFNLSGSGALNMNAATGGTASSTLQVGRSDSPANNTTNTFNQTGGTANVAIFSVGGNGTNGTDLSSAVNWTGGTFVADSFPLLAAGNNNTATLTIGGSADVTLPNFPTTRGTGSTATLTFDGGVLRPTASSTAYLGGLTNAFVNGGGARFNTGAFNITVSQALLAGTGSGGLTKEGSGALTLSGASTYSGATNIRNGSIILGGGNDRLLTTGSVILGDTGTSGRLVLGDGTARNQTLGGLTTTGLGGSVVGGASTNSTLTLNIASGTNTFGGTLGGAGTNENNLALIKEGSGLLSLTSNNSFTGNVTVNAGTLRIGSSTALGTGTKTLSSAGANRNVELTGGITLGSNISLSLSSNSGDGLGLSSISGVNQVQGNITFTSGNPALNISSSSGSTLTISGNLTYNVANNTRPLHLGGSSATNNTISGVISQTGTGAVMNLIKQGTGRWVLANANTFTGTTTITGGTLALTNNLALQNSPLDTAFTGGGSLDLTAVNTPTIGGFTGAGNMVLPSNVTALTLNPASGVTATHTGNISGGTGLSLTKTGAGTQILSGTNSYSGLTTVNGGELRVTSAAALSGTNVTVSSGQLALSGGITISGKTITTSGSGTNFLGGLQSVSGTNTWAGDVILGADQARMGARRNATLVVSGSIDDGANTFGVIFRNENQSGTNGGGNATTVTEISGANTYGGNTMVIAGVTRLAGGDNRLPTGTVLQFGLAGANARFDMNGRNQEVAGLAVMSTSLDGNRDWNANELTNSSGTLSTLTVNTTANQTFGRTTSSFTGSENYTGVITGNIALVKSGSATLTLTGTNTYTGATTINSGTLALGTGGSISASTTIDVKGSATLDVSALAGWALANGQTLSGTGTVNAGTGNVVTISNGAILAPGASPGTLLVNGDLSLASGSTFSAELQTSGGLTADLVNLAGDLDILSGALLDLGIFGTDAALTNGTKFSLFSYSGSWNSGTFTGYADDSDFVLGLNQFRINYNDTVAGVNGGLNSSFVTLTVVPEPRAALLAGIGMLALLRRRRPQAAR